MCLANCCSGPCASLSGIWELTEARVGIPALCWMEQGVAMLVKAVQVQVVEQKLEHLPIPLGVMGTLWEGFLSLVRFCRVKTQCRQNRSYLVEGGLWVISFPSESSPS